MKRYLSIWVSIVLILALAAPALAADGVFEGVARGMNGEVKVQVTLAGDRIESVVVTENAETYGIGRGLPQTPIEALPAQIVAAQSIGVDMITGATITSAALLGAVKDALTQAGADVAALSVQPEATPAQDGALDADVVIAGAGAAGLAAGIQAASDGAKVIILEKQGITGGATARSGGKFLAAGTTWQAAQGIEDDADQMYDYLMQVGGDYLNADKVRIFCDHATETLAWIEDMGAVMKDVEPIHSSLNPWRVHNAYGAGGMTSGHGGQYTVPMTNKFTELGGQIIYNATATEILTDEGGAACGLIARTAEGGTLTVNASAVVLATGGYAQNKELMAAIPSAAGSTTSVPKGNLGDGLTMARALGAKVYLPDYTQVVYCSMTCGVGINEEAGLIVNARGERVANEYTYQYHVSDQIAKSGCAWGWYIACPDDPNMTVQYGLSLDSTLKADSVEALAGLMEVDPATLTATVDRYNELCQAGEDADFGKPADKMLALSGPVYAAIRMNPAVTVTYGGLDTDTASRVLRDDGTAIPGLYAAGEVAFTGLFGTEYPCCGMAIGSAAYYGRVAGREAAALAR